MAAVDPSSSAELERGRTAYRCRQWSAAWDALVRADRQAGLEPDDLWRLGLSAYLTGREDEFVAALERAHRLYLAAQNTAAAVRCAFWIGVHLGERGEVARATGWLGRATRLLQREPAERVERGYLLLPAVRRQLAAGELEAAYRMAGEAAEVGERFADADLIALAVHLQGRVRLVQERVEEGLALLDEAMIAVATDELSPQVTGLIYCSMISACRGVYALGRAHEWTAALAGWCDRQPDMVAYTGECRLHRAELLQLHGSWRQSIEEAQRAAGRLPSGAVPVIALAYYQKGEGHRLLGELAAAEEAYRAASQAGREPQPGLALLRLAQGDLQAAAPALRRALAETRDPLRRVRLLPAAIQIMLELHDLEQARQACAELERLAGSYGSGVLRATVAYARGSIDLAAGNAGAALPQLRLAWQEWTALDIPYEAARARVLLGLACRALGDGDGAALELQAARATFQRLGASGDLARLDALDRAPAARSDHGLTPRELEILAAVATGRTNRAIADQLFISEKTVARHLSNIFSKLDLPSRAAATAWAYEHGLAGPPG